MSGRVFWSSVDARPERLQRPLPRKADVIVVGAGYTGLWAAIRVLESDPTASVLVIDAARVGDGPSGRNGGWLEPSLTHGIENGERRFPGEIADLERIARENLRDIERFFVAHAIECDYEPAGTLEIATDARQERALDALAAAYERHDWHVDRLDAGETRAQIDSERFLGAVAAPGRGGVLDPLKLVRGLADTAERLGAAILENTPVTALRRAAGGVEVVTAAGRARCDQVLLAVDGATRRFIRRAGLLATPVEDYVMVSEPLPDGVAWRTRAGASDLAYAFSSFRLTADNRLYWGGSEAIYRFGRRLGDGRDPGPRPASWERLARAVAEYFPPLAGLLWPFQWSGPIPITTRFTPALGRALNGRVHFALGYTGLGVAASRVAATILADRALTGRSQLDDLEWASRAPLPFPPEPFRALGVHAMHRALARADRTGRLSLLARALDQIGIGFSS